MLLKILKIQKPCVFMHFSFYKSLQKPTKSLQMSYKLSDEKDLTKSQIEYFFSPIATLYYLL